MTTEKVFHSPVNWINIAPTSFLVPPANAVGDIDPGMLVRRAAGGAATTAPGGTNVGNGTISAVVLKPVFVLPGVYRLEVTNISPYLVKLMSPEGATIAMDLPIPLVSTLHMDATVTNGSTPFSIGDFFNITVPVSNETWVLVGAAELPEGVVYSETLKYDTTTGKYPYNNPVPVAVAYRHIRLNKSNLTYPVAATTVQRAAMDAALVARGFDFAVEAPLATLSDS